MNTISVQVAPPPTTPLNLQIGQAYSSRVPAPPFVGFAAQEVQPDYFEVWAYRADGTGEIVYRGDLQGAWRELTAHLRMDVAP